VSVRALEVWWHGSHVGTWSPAGRTEARFAYTEAWTRAAHGCPISVSLPFVPYNREATGAVVDDWFANLLPDSDAILTRMRDRLHLRDTKPASLLAVVGRDCVGAVQLVLPGDTPEAYQRIDVKPLSDAEVARRLRRVTAKTEFAAETNAIDEMRFSLAGAQEKTAFTRHKGQWCVPFSETPTTHIFKLPLTTFGDRQADLSLSVENEWLSLRLLAALELPVAQAVIGRFQDDYGSISALIVTRFDRVIEADDTGAPVWIRRVLQEDMCQALGVPTSRKYQEDGGPGINRILTLLAGARNPDRDQQVFANSQLAGWLLAAPDGHAKNYSISHTRAGYSLTPLYDVMSAWPFIGRGAREYPIQQMKLAMSFRGKSKPRLLDKIHLRHWRRLANDAGGDEVFAAMIAMVEQVPRAISVVEGEMPSDFPEVIWERITTGMQRQGERFLAMVAGESD
jgi:serine/threonine-protein kinase HipA